MCRKIRCDEKSCKVLGFFDVSKQGLRTVCFVAYIYTHVRFWLTHARGGEKISYYISNAKYTS